MFQLNTRTLEAAKAKLGNSNAIGKPETLGVLFTGAHLRDANLVGADLESACLRDAIRD